MSSRSRSPSQTRQKSVQFIEYGHHTLAEPGNIENSERDWKSQGGVPNTEIPRVRRTPTPYPFLPQQAGQIRGYAGSALVEPEYDVKVKSNEEGQQRAGGIAASRTWIPSANAQRMRQEEEQYRPRHYDLPDKLQSFDPGPYYRDPEALQRREEINPPGDYRVRSSATRSQESARPAPPLRNKIIDLRDNQSWVTERTRSRDAGLGRKYKEIPDGN